MIMGTSEQSFAEALHQAHTDLFRDIQQLEEAVHSGSQKDPTTLGAHLRKVQTHLTEHFQFEEQGGYMAPLLKEEPRFAQVVKELLDEHRQLAQSIEALIREA